MKLLIAVNFFLLLTISASSQIAEKEARASVADQQVLGSSTTVDFRNSVEDLLDTLLANEIFRSVSVGVIKNGKVYKFHRGKLMDGKVPTDNTLYEIASLTKTFTGTLLAKAILDNKVKLNDDINNYLPEPFPNLVYEGQFITFKHLVTHRSGLPGFLPNKPELFVNPDYDKLPFELYKLQSGFSRTMFWKELHQVRLDTIPGYKFSYSNAGANLLELLLERMYGISYEALVKMHILTPLKMNNTYIGISQENAGLAVKGKNTNGVEMPLQASKELNGEGGVISTLNDMLNYMQFHLQKNNAVVKLSHQELLNGRYKDFENGMFWQIIKNGDKPDTIFQNGGAFGTSSWMSLIPQTNTGVFIITNISGPKVHQKLSATVDQIVELINLKRSN